jgi:hypothetical protein
LTGLVAFDEPGFHHFTGFRIHIPQPLIKTKVRWPNSSCSWRLPRDGHCRERHGH